MFPTTIFHSSFCPTLKPLQKFPELFSLLVLSRFSSLVSFLEFSLLTDFGPCPMLSSCLDQADYEIKTEKSRNFELSLSLSSGLVSFLESTLSTDFGPCPMLSSCLDQTKYELQRKNHELSIFTTTLFRNSCSFLESSLSTDFRACPMVDFSYGSRRVIEGGEVKAKLQSLMSGRLVKRIRYMATHLILD